MLVRGKTSAMVSNVSAGVRESLAPLTGRAVGGFVPWADAPVHYVPGRTAPGCSCFAADAACCGSRFWLGWVPSTEPRSNHCEYILDGLANFMDIVPGRLPDKFVDSTGCSFYYCVWKDSC